MEKCRKTAYLLSKQKDQAQLSAKERIFLNSHLLICPNCREYKKQLELIEAALKNLF